MAGGKTRQGRWGGVRGRGVGIARLRGREFLRVFEIY